MNFQENNKAIYLQIADRMCDDILCGVYRPGSRIPSVREMASSLEVNANTMMRSYDYLQQLGFIFNKRGIGYFVADDAPIAILGNRKEQFFNSEAAYFFERLRIFGITPESLADSYADYCVRKEQQLQDLSQNKKTK